MVSVTRVPNSWSDLWWPQVFSECFALWIDRSRHLLVILQVRASAQHGCSEVAPRVWLARRRTHPNGLLLRRLSISRCELRTGAAQSRHRRRRQTNGRRRQTIAQPSRAVLSFITPRFRRRPADRLFAVSLVSLRGEHDRPGLRRIGVRDFGQRFHADAAAHDDGHLVD